eukprot:7977526-Pyramimonas_sp.AAC.1
MLSLYWHRTPSLTQPQRQIDGGSFEKRGSRPGAAHTPFPDCPQLHEWATSTFEIDKGHVYTFRGRTLE